jgi:hypothetical protein
MKVSGEERKDSLAVGMLVSRAVMQTPVRAALPAALSPLPGLARPPLLLLTVQYITTIDSRILNDQAWPGP